MPSDKQNAEFCYAMLKQLDLKYIDWNLVASENSVSNGHAARMRYSRFRKHMEEQAPHTRGQRMKDTKDKGKVQTKRQKVFMSDDDDEDGNASTGKIKDDSDSEPLAKKIRSSVKEEPKMRGWLVKPEQDEDDDVVMIKSEDVMVKRELVG